MPNPRLPILVGVLLTLIWTGVVHTATPCLGPNCPGDSVHFTDENTVNVPILLQADAPVLDTRSVGVCPAGQFVTAISLTNGPTCAVGSATSGAFFVLTEAHASLPNAQLLGANILMRGSHAARPAAGIAGRRYFYTDAPFGAARDNGTTWDEDQLDWAQVTNRTTLAHAASHSPGQSDDLSATYATRAYADAISQGLDIKESVTAGTTTALPSSTYSNGTAGVGATIQGSANGALAAQDGITLTVNQTLLVKDEPVGFRNGCYSLTTVGDLSNPFVLTRRTDCDTAAEVDAGLFVFIEQGATLADTGWVMITNNPITIGTTTLTFAQFSGGGTVLGGAGLVKTGNVLDVGAGTCLTVGADTVSVTAACLTDTQILGISGPKITSGTVDPARLPLPTLTTPGVIKAKDCTATSLPYVGGIDTNGDPICFGDITGTGGSPPTTTLSNLIGASVTATTFIPANSLLIGVRAQVLTTITGATSFQVGVPTDLDRYGAAIAPTLGTVTNISDFQQTEPTYYAAATDVIVTANGSDFTAGEVKLLLYYTTLDAFHISGPSATVSAVSQGQQTLTLTGPTDLQFGSDDATVTIGLSTLQTVPSTIFGLNFRSTSTPTLQALVDTANGTMSGFTAARPLKLTGTDADGASLHIYESSGSMFIDCKLADGTFCDHLIELATNRKYAIGTSVQPEAFRLLHAEPETLDLSCRTNDPTTADANRGKLYCKNDAPYFMSDVGTASALALGTHTHAASDITSGTKSIYLPAGAMEVSGGCTLNAAAALLTNGPKLATISCTDADADSIEFDLVMPDGWNGGTITIELVAFSIGNNTTEVLEMDFAGQCVSSGDTPTAHSTTGEQPATITWGNAANREQHATTAAITLQGSCLAGDHVYMRGQVDSTATTFAPMVDLRVLGVKLEYSLSSGSD